MDKIRVLVSLLRGYGLGDAVQMSSVLRHVKKYRPHWKIDFQAEAGRESVGRGIADRVFIYGEPYGEYDAEVQMILYDTFANWTDRPNTRVTSCLHERFAIEWDRTLARYQVQVRPESLQQARVLVPPRSVAVHYQGDSAKEAKDLTDTQASVVCDWLIAHDYTPLLLDWRGVSKLKYKSLVSPHWGRDAEMNCAVISLCEAFVGIDSGPGKCASATDTPTLITWIGHHPALFHDPAENTTHLVPVGCHDKYPGVVEFFEANYRHRTYTDPVKEIIAWLSATL